ncbi:TPA: restriction endonuclease subunit S [Escherichia coli]|uniref:restriction endonuclease subunit S n=1 Tax=Enterobacteriaceae TaxID=543 RepID=UPI00180B7272|nr:MULTISPECIES: restriction endonuclease subunit S [Enterobacteriaceae]EFB2687323.1 restriction endonuclease subunit S [Escherichia coli O157:H7]EFB2691737.1 restriction endonuclease subunit S [Escherichia coli O157:H7]EFB2709973.1 restriction endonuclease subunit S [Escherichia coli O157:H7]EFB2719001.1 restriction endonuclease subunit S [Escherichia coli O157:H7]EFB2727785.1 restriction endonuclease subunit S [Escherichia coli O157:H7]
MVPKGWTLLQVSDICKLQNGNSFKPHEWDTQGLPIIRIQNLNGSDNYNYFSGVPQDKWLVEPGQLLFSWAGTKGVSFGPFIWNGPKGVLNQHIYKVFANENVHGHWLYLALLHITQKIEAQAHGFKSTLLHVQKKDIDNQFVLTPPVAEQKKMAQILSTWDKAISVTEKLLTNSQQQKKALMQQLLTGKKRLPDENGVSFSGAWKWLRAAELFKTISQKNNSEDEELLAVTQDLGVIPRSMLERRVVMPDGSTKGYKLVVPGNFIISLRSFQGGLEYSRYRGLVSPAYTVLTPIKKIVDEFYKQYYKSYDFIGHLAVAVIGIRDGKQISYEDFSFLKLPYPEIEEQQKIAAVLSAADAEISTLEKKLACLRDEKKALMQQLLTGKRRVKVDEAVAE